MRLPLAASSRTAQQRVPHLSEPLTSLLAGRVALNSSDPPNPGISQKGVLVSGSQSGHPSGSPIENSCFFTRTQNITSAPSRNCDPGGCGSTLARVGREGQISQLPKNAEIPLETNIISSRKRLHPRLGIHLQNREVLSLGQHGNRPSDR